MAENEIRIYNLEKRVDKLETKEEKMEQVINDIDKTLQVSLEQVKNIAEDLKQTSINFKEAMMRSNTANSKETEILKEKCVELEKKYETLNVKIDKETIGRDAKNWRDSKSKIISWVITAVLGIVATALGISKFM